jgi:hypothetical protein
MNVGEAVVANVEKILLANIQTPLSFVDAFARGRLFMAVSSDAARVERAGG